MADSTPAIGSSYASTSRAAARFNRLNEPPNPALNPALNAARQAPSSARQCAADLMETVPVLMQFIRSEMRRQGAALVSVPQFRVLTYLNRHPGASLSHVAEHIGVTRATASAMTDRLVQRGLIHRAEQPQERRQIMLHLTPSGVDHLQTAREGTLHALTALFDSLTEMQRAELSAGLGILQQVFAEAIEAADAD